VFLIWALDGWFPSTRALRNPEDADEERRLMYVAMTRARDELYITYPIGGFASRGGGYSMAQLSRFIDQGVRAFMNQLVAINPETEIPEARSRGAQPVMDVRALLRGRFSST